MFLKNKIIKQLYKVFKYRPSSYPYITGDGFRKMANHIYDEIKKCDPKKIKRGDIVFVKSDMLIDFFEKIHSKINNEYVLISHNSDKNIDEKYIKYIDDKIIHWFAQNLLFEHEKVTTIPIGIENKHLNQNGRLCLYKCNLNRKDKIDKVLFGFNVNTNIKTRTVAQKELREIDNAEEIKNKLSIKEYMETLSKYKYVASPPGNGVDCIRTWEAIILGVVPICLNNKNTQLLIDLGAPIISINNYSELKDTNLLEKKYNMLKSKFENTEIFKLDFWGKKIKEKNV